MTATREYQRILLEQLPAYAALGWAPATDLPTGAVVVDCFAGGTQQAVLVSREVEREVAGIVLDSEQARALDDEPRQLTLDERHLVEDVIAALRMPGQPKADHHHMLVMDLLQALVEVAELRGDRDTARRHVAKRLELQRARAAGQGG